jgi:hypothetical protein
MAMPSADTDELASFGNLGSAHKRLRFGARLKARLTLPMVFV